jgi:hypothetical protein
VTAMILRSSERPPGNMKPSSGFVRRPDQPGRAHRCAQTVASWLFVPAFRRVFPCRDPRRRGDTAGQLEARAGARSDGETSYRMEAGKDSQVLLIVASSTARVKMIHPALMVPAIAHAAKVF